MTKVIAADTKEGQEVFQSVQALKPLECVDGVDSVDFVNLVRVVRLMDYILCIDCLCLEECILTYRIEDQAVMITVKYWW